MDQINAMRAFMHVVRLGSFTAAGEALGIPKASVSLALQQLESQLGTRLLHRTTRRVQLTQDGQVFHERCMDLLTDLDELQGLFRAEPERLRGRIRVDMPLAVASEVVLPNLPAFLECHPELLVELSSTDRRVDVVREGFDCVLRVGTLTDSSLIARTLGYYRMVNCVSKGYLARFGEPESLEDLGRHRLVHYQSSFGGRTAGFEYASPAAPGRAAFLAMPGAVTVNNSDAYLHACRSGLGIIQVPQVGVQTYLDKGSLCEVLPGYRPVPMPVSLLYANRRQLPRRVQAFMNWIADLMRPRLLPELVERPVSEHS